ncbi:MAG: glucoamylase family protein [Chitinophagaceae bacterium]
MYPGTNLGFWVKILMPGFLVENTDNIIFTNRQDLLYHQSDYFMLPQAIASIKKTIIDPFLGVATTNKYAQEKPPLRSELFPVEQMELYAKTLAKNHVLTSGHPPEQLLKRLAGNEELLLEVHGLLTESVKANKSIVPAGEWLLDNFYLIEEQVYTGKKHLPKGYSKGLPQLGKGKSEGLPRVYDIAVQIISHSDGRVDLRGLTKFIHSYQSVTPLKLGELWAIPIMLRLALLENLRRLATQIAADILNKNQADYWADEMTRTAEKDPKSLVLVIADMARSNPPMVSSFVAELTRRLQGKGSSLALPLSWIEQRLSENGLTSSELVHLENQKQAADQVSISNSINSLRFLNTTDWREFVEDTSIVEKILRTDTDGIYPKMDFHTRDMYRHSVESISKNSDLPEQEIAVMAINYALNSKTEGGNERASHVGYYLIGNGKPLIEKMAAIRYKFRERCRGYFNKFPFAFYSGAIILFTVCFSISLFGEAYMEGLRNWWLAPLALVCLLASSRLGSILVNWVATITARPNLLPRLDFSKGIPESYRSMVVVPTLLGNSAELESLLESLEVRFLANRNAYLHFALLTDFKDADAECLPGDQELLLLAREKIQALNKKYGASKNEFFFLFHRPRKWNLKEKKWMGYERKRGKLGDLNALLRGHGKEQFMMVVADEGILTSIKYIITLDTDTLLPRDAAWKMIGTMAHPLNRACFSKEKQRVTDGYGILQPRVSNSLPLSESSIYTRIHGNEPGTDPYTRAISDVYQDLFGEGSFIGKGIYDIDAFELALKDRFPDNRILSHDLLEGCYSRSGLISDIQLYEEYPSSYSVDIKRRHRWIRGDWQIARWLFPRVPGAHNKRFKNPLSALSRWKIFDNLRRSLVPIALLLLMLFGWMVSATPLLWTLTIIIILALPSGIIFIWDVCHKPDDMELWQHFSFSVKSTIDNFIQHLLDLVFLPYEAYVNADAVLRTNWRLFISGKKLLEWNPSNNAINTAPKTLPGFFAAMWFTALFSAGLFAYFVWYLPDVLLVAGPVLVLWLLAPAVAWYISRPSTKQGIQLSTDNRVYLQQLARKIWAFFEDFVTEADNWLPPDNYQLYPSPKIAHRTSPTNIGLSLLASLGGWDFGYISAGKLIERTANTLNTMLSLEKFHGHLYNWYDTETMLPLSPRYVSSVDSGNLAGHLITLKQGLSNLGSQLVFTNKVFDGLLDAAGLLLETVKDQQQPVILFLDHLRSISVTPVQTLQEAKKAMDTTDVFYHDHILSLCNSSQQDTALWATKIGMQIKDSCSDLVSLAPWLQVQGAPTKFGNLLAIVSAIPTLQSLARIEAFLLPELKSYPAAENSIEENTWLENFGSRVAESGRRAKERLLLLESLVLKCTQLSNIDYDFLFDRTQNLLSIGYNVQENRRDLSYYDLLASESRLSTYVGIAQGKLPQESWFALGRQLTNTGTTPILLSWSGSMFEYLMPMLVMPSYPNTLLHQTHTAIVEKQIDYGRKRSVPWGISESGYNMVDANLNYQYRAFGVPGLGFKRGLGEDLVISPYSTIMALMVLPEAACANLEKMAAEGFEDTSYGFYEAVDYTTARLPRGQHHEIIRSFMVHHQGMSFLSLAYVLLDQPMQKRFETEVQFQATLLLLQERIPRVSTFYSPSVHVADTSVVNDNNTPMRVIHTPSTPIPEVQLLSNGRYHVMVTNSGGGYSRWKDIAITRWREDSTCDNWGAFCYIRDLDSNALWSSSYQPTLQEGENYEAVFSQGRAEFRRRDHSLETHTEIVVSPEDDVELRRITIANRSRKKRYIEVTSYAEVVLAPAAADAAHPAFSNLFVQTEIVGNRNAIVCTRRPRSEHEHTPSMFHLMKVHHAKVEGVSYETNRSNFTGRGNTSYNPVVFTKQDPLSDTQGSVLDPIIAIQYRIVIEAQESATIDMVTGIAETREICNGLVEKYQDRHLTDRAFELSWTHSQVVLRQINAIETDAQLYARLAGSVIYSNPSLRADPGIIAMNQRGQSGLWSYSISGDLPIVLVQIENAEKIELVHQLIQAHAYWRLKGLVVDLVIWNDDHGSYRQNLQNEILGLIAPIIGADVKEQPGGIFIRSGDQLSNEDRILFQSVARIVISDNLGTLEEQLMRRNKVKGIIPYFNPVKFHMSLSTAVQQPEGLQFFNGFGGFSKDGKEYVIMSGAGKVTPAPWVNVLANPEFGTVVSESGQSYTWAENAHEYRLTPWNDDPVGDLNGETFYVRDEESGKFWTPTALPGNSKLPYITRHGFGYSIFEHIEDGVHTEMTVFVDLDSPIKFTTIRFHNQSGRPRRLSATGYVEWVLADLRPKSLMHIITESDTETGAILARNSYNTEMATKVAFFDADDPIKAFTTDRAEFIGRNGTLGSPEAMGKARLSGKSGAAIDACAVIQVPFDLAEGEEHTLIFRLGAGRDHNDAVSIIRRFKGLVPVQDAFDKVKRYWQQKLGILQIATPDAATNILANGWLTYQALACRIWGRSGFYQSGGAFGFRDQLQDVLSLLFVDADVTKKQILLSASRQFKEGDVQHWWHPPAGRGVRTTCSDDYLWLPFVVSRYVKHTGDLAVLDESVGFLEGRLLNVGEESYYDLPIRSNNFDSLYNHCIKSILHGLRFGVHGLPLMGSGDWNDGMDKVGEHGKGESVWLAFFLYEVLVRFAQIAHMKGDENFMAKCTQEAEKLRSNIEANAWDGKWYRRAYFDDGTPLGSAVNDECRIDSIAQSWSVLSGAAGNQRRAMGIESANQYLVDRPNKLIQLFDPPFDVSALNPGYIKGYVPGVRENGGQYTHAAIWLVMAFAALQNKERTWELLKMINPINHGNSEEGIARYKVEPYVMAADIYKQPLHTGRGGWTWYTGSAGWMYQLIIESFLGLKREGAKLMFNPCVPEQWTEFGIKYRFEETNYSIRFSQSKQQEGIKVSISGVDQKGNSITLVNDRMEHVVEVVIGLTAAGVIG